MIRSRDHDLAQRFKENFAKFTDRATQDVIDAGARV